MYPEKKNKTNIFSGMMYTFTPPEECLYPTRSENIHEQILLKTTIQYGI